MICDFGCRRLCATSFFLFVVAPILLLHTYIFSCDSVCFDVVLCCFPISRLHFEDVCRPGRYGGCLRQKLFCTYFNTHFIRTYIQGYLILFQKYIWQMENVACFSLPYLKKGSSFTSSISTLTANIALVHPNLRVFIFT